MDSILRDRTESQHVVQPREPMDNEEVLDQLVQKLIQKQSPVPGRPIEDVTTAGFPGMRGEELAGQDESQDAPGAVTCPQPAPATHTALDSRFRLVNRHKDGGHGEVWIAEDTELERMVALKRLKEAYADDPAYQDRFLYEARVTGTLVHRGIPAVYALGYCARGRPYYAMHFIAGMSLHEAIRKFHQSHGRSRDADGRTLELRRLLARFVDVCNTMAFAHSRGVVHRDIKPENIVLDEYGETLVIDWGLARVAGCAPDTDADSLLIQRPVRTGSRLTGSGATMGTTAYMSPEQAAGRSADAGPASDIYSLGATLYTLLTGTPPFPGSDETVILPKLIEGDLPRPRQVNPLVPAALEAVCRKAMNLAPEDRYESAEELGEEIERWLADQPVTVHRDPLLARAGRWVRRHKPWVAAATALLVISVSVLAIADVRISREQVRTADQLDMTRDALRELLTLSGENLAFLPNTERLRSYLAEKVLDRYRQLGEKFPADPGVRLETALVHRVIAGIGRITGQFHDALEHYRTAIEILTGLAQEHPGEQNYRRWLVETYTDCGELFHMNGRVRGAEEQFQAAIAEAKKLYVLAGSPSDHKRAKASVWINFSEILTLKNEFSVACAAADQAADLLRRLAADPDSTRPARDLWLLSMALTDRAAASKEIGRLEDATADLEAAARCAHRILQGKDQFEDAQFQLAVISNQRGDLLARNPARRAESAECFDQAAEILSTLVKRHRLIPHYREQLAATLLGQGSVCLAQGRLAVAYQNCETARNGLEELLREHARKQSPENPQYLSLLGQVLALRGQVEERQERARESRRTLAQAAENLGRAVALDPSRIADKVRLDTLKNRLDRLGR